MKNKNNTENMENETKGFSFYDEVKKGDDAQIEIGKNLITDIAMTCSNDYRVIDSLLELLELFTVKDAKVSTMDLAEQLQDYLFRWTKEYGNAVDAWKDSVLYGEKYQTSKDAESVPLGTPVESTNTSDLAKQLSDLINNPDLPEPIQEDLKDSILNTFSMHADQSEIIKFEDSPQYIEMVLRGYANRQGGQND
jgi:hypothetical protein